MHPLREMMAIQATRLKAANMSPKRKEDVCKKCCQSKNIEIASLQRSVTVPTFFELMDRRNSQVFTSSPLQLSSSGKSPSSPALLSSRERRKSVIEEPPLMLEEEFFFIFQHFEALLAMTSELLQLLDQRLDTWESNFFGDVFLDKVETLWYIRRNVSVHVTPLFC